MGICSSCDTDTDSGTNSCHSHHYRPAHGCGHSNPFCLTRDDVIFVRAAETPILQGPPPYRYNNGNEGSGTLPSGIMSPPSYDIYYYNNSNPSRNDSYPSYQTPTAPPAMSF